MVKFGEKETTPVEPGKAVVSSPAKVEDKTAIELAQLRTEEANLKQEKQDLETLKEKLAARAREEVEKKRADVQRLKTEILDLRAVCGTLTKSLNENQAGQPPG